MTCADSDRDTCLAALLQVLSHLLAIELISNTSCRDSCRRGRQLRLALRGATRGRERVKQGALRNRPRSEPQLEWMPVSGPIRGSTLKLNVHSHLQAHQGLSVLPGHNLTRMAWVLFQPSPMHKTCLQSFALPLSCLMKLLVACLSQCDCRLGTSSSPAFPVGLPASEST